ncbi:hypothetical protein B0H67DRAFT_552560 [Lasiosphaeris hirsuta]|uniref:Uncharacterized protein n=1 Tax=Lasiosphaeris hirsuta TaxID=260670 RepID=A0AA40AQY4_9PEZI|nr:hypothetical protein B0H67DRAFT_552560 [Lasiosphaeris hirsuta]
MTRHRNRRGRGHLGDHRPPSAAPDNFDTDMLNNNLPDPGLGSPVAHQSRAASFHRQARLGAGNPRSGFSPRPPVLRRYGSHNNPNHTPVSHPYASQHHRPYHRPPSSIGGSDHITISRPNTPNCVACAGTQRRNYVLRDELVALLGRTDRALRRWAGDVGVGDGDEDDVMDWQREQAALVVPIERRLSEMRRIVDEADRQAATGDSSSVAAGEDGAEGGRIRLSKVVHVTPPCGFRNGVLGNGARSALPPYSVLGGLGGPAINVPAVNGGGSMMPPYMSGAMCVPVSAPVVAKGSEAAPCLGSAPRPGIAPYPHQYRPSPPQYTTPPPGREWAHVSPNGVRNHPPTAAPARTNGNWTPPWEYRNGDGDWGDSE